MSGRGRGRSHGRGGHGNNRGRGSGRTSSRPRNNDRNDDSKTEKVKFTPHCGGKTQGTTCDTVKKQIIHSVRSKCKFGNNLAEWIESNNQHKTKEDPWKHLGFADSVFENEDDPTQLELMDCTKFKKERNKQI